MGRDAERIFANVRGAITLQAMRPEKMNLRKVMRDRLAGLSPAWRSAASETLARRIGELPAWNAAQVVGLFAGRMDEMETEKLWPLAFGKEICYPLVQGDELKFHRVGTVSDLSPGRWGLLEPPGVAEKSPDFLLVPGLAFDATGARLGRGRGFYDRWLGKNPATVRWGVCFEFQRVSRVPAEAHDAKMDGVITENAVYAAR